MTDKAAPLRGLLTPQRVRAQVLAGDWALAVAAAGELLVSTQACTPGYVDAMKAAVRDLGPYIVVAPGVAMPHARPEKGVLVPAVAVITLAEPVAFGHLANDPVDLVIAFAAVDKNAHLETLQRIVELLQTPGALALARAAGSTEELYAAVAGEGHDAGRPESDPHSNVEPGEKP